MNIGVIIIATNAYSLLGIRLVNQFLHNYKGNAKITFYFFSEDNLNDYIDCNCNSFLTQHRLWIDATNSKFVNILQIERYLGNEDYIFYIDADTGIRQEFTEEILLGDLVGAEHFDNKSRMKEVKSYDRNPCNGNKSNFCQIPFFTRVVTKNHESESYGNQFVLPINASSVRFGDFTHYQPSEDIL